MTNSKWKKEFDERFKWLDRVREHFGIHETIEWSKEVKDFILELIKDSHRNRCILYGCIYGIPGIDEKPKDHCIYCGEPNQNDFWADGIIKELL